MVDEELMGIVAGVLPLVGMVTVTVLDNWAEVEERPETLLDV